MLNKIKFRIEKSLKDYIKGLDKLYSLNKISPLLSNSIKDFVLRKGKRLRPILFVLGYLGYSKKVAAKLYTSAISIELLHDFMLVHDDIIDKSSTRRGMPSMHTMLNSFLKNKSKTKFSGEDLAIVAGDVIYAMALQAFLAIKENMQRKESAFHKLIKATFYTGCGEFIELIGGIKEIKKVKKSDIYKIYDYKTSHYTFACPLVMGAILAGAKKNQTDKLFKFGICLGRAFQIKDDILGMFNSAQEIGKSATTDLQEAKKTLLIWYAYNNSASKIRLIMKKILLKEKRITIKDLQIIRTILIDSGALDYAQREVCALIKEAESLLKSLKIKKQYKQTLLEYSKQILKV